MGKLFSIALTAALVWFLFGYMITGCMGKETRFYTVEVTFQNGDTDTLEVEAPTDDRNMFLDRAGAFQSHSNGIVATGVRSYKILQ